MRMSEKKGMIQQESFNLALLIIDISDKLVAKQEFIFARQLLRSGTAVGAMVREAQNAESKRDFVHKLAIAQKECDETIYWVELLISTKKLPIEDLKPVATHCTSVLKIIRSAIITTKRRFRI